MLTAGKMLIKRRGKNTNKFQ